MQNVSKNSTVIKDTAPKAILLSKGWIWIYDGNTWLAGQCTC